MSRKAITALKNALPARLISRSFATSAPVGSRLAEYLANRTPDRARYVGAALSSPESSSTATSSQITLDHPFWVDGPSLNTTRPPLAYATDSDLVQCLLLPEADVGISGNGYEKHAQEHWLDPVMAFKELRSRPIYLAFLQGIHPFLDTLYPRFKNMAQHQLLVSDLLLRYPDPRLLRDLLELDAQTVRPIHRISSLSPSKLEETGNLRPASVASINSIIAWQIRRGSLQPLGYRAHLLICRSLAAQDDVTAMKQSWHNLRLSSPTSNANSAYTLLTFIVRIARLDPAAAFGMLHSLVRDEALPRGILLKGLGEHPDRLQIMILAAAVQSCLHWNMDRRARYHAEQLLDLIRNSGGQVEQVSEAVDLVMDMCRGVVAKRSSENADDGLEWCGRIFHQMGRGDRGLEIPAPLFNAWLSAVPSSNTSGIPSPTYDLDVWKSLPPHRRPAISARNLLGLAQRCTNMKLFAKIVMEIINTDPLDAIQISRPLLRLISRQQITIQVRRNLLNYLIRHWSGCDLKIGGQDLTRLIQLMRADKARCRAILHAYEARLLAEHSRRGQIQLHEILAMVHSYLLLKDKEDASDWLQLLHKEDEDVRAGLWEMRLWDGNVRVSLKELLRSVYDAEEVKAILSGHASVQ